MLKAVRTRNGKFYRGLNEKSLKDIEFARRTIIYGANGSGKSSISQLLADIEGLAPDWRPVWIDGSKKTYVFNDEYVSNNLREFVEDGGTSPSIIVGEASIELATQKEFYTEQIANSGKRVSSLQSALDESSPDLILKEAKQAVIVQLQECDAKNYNTASYRANNKLLQKIQQASSADITPEEFTRLKELGIRTAADSPARTMNIDLQHLKNSLVYILSVLATSLPIPEHLKYSDLPGFSDWAVRGLSYTDQTGNECPFCLNQIDEHRMSKLVDEYRDETRKTLSGKLEAVETELNTARQELDDYTQSITRIKISDSIIGAQLDKIRSKITPALDDLKLYIVELDSALKDKMVEKERPFIIAEHKGFDDLVRLSSELSDLCSDYNETLESWESDKKSAIERLESHILSKYSSPLEDAIEKHQRLSDLMVLISEHEQYYTTELNNILASESNSLRMADYITAGIALVLGRNEVEVKANSDGLTYSLVRQGESARNLSEGERQIIAILYFLATLKSNNADLNDAVVVVDDPTTGLDRNNYRALFEHLYQESNEWQQLILLTHDFSFYSTAIRVFQSNGAVAKWGDPALLLTERKWSERPGQFCCYARQAPLAMTKYSSEYYSVFHNVARAAAGQIVETDLSMYGNIGRRLLESFLSYHAPNNFDVTSSIVTVWNNINWSRSVSLNLDVERIDGQVSDAFVEIPLSVIRRFHSFSHDSSTTPFEEPLMFISSDDFVKLLFVMRSVDKEHFDLMLECVDTEGEKLHDRIWHSFKSIYGALKRYANTGVIAL